MVALAHPLLEIVAVECGNGFLKLGGGHEQRRGAFIEKHTRLGILRRIPRQRQVVRGVGPGRSEEHTSELQSLMRISYAVFCLKKKNSAYTHKLHERTYHY